MKQVEKKLNQIKKKREKLGKQPINAKDARAVFYALLTTFGVGIALRVVEHASASEIESEANNLNSLGSEAGLELPSSSVNNDLYSGWEKALPTSKESEVVGSEQEVVLFSTSEEGEAAALEVSAETTETVEVRAKTQAAIQEALESLQPGQAMRIEIPSGITIPVTDESIVIPYIENTTVEIYSEAEPENRPVFEGETVYRRHAMFIVKPGVSAYFENLEITGQLEATNGGGILVEEGSQTKIENCYIHGNTAVNGAGVYGYYPLTLEIKDCLLDSNEVEGRGGHVFIYGRADLIRIINSTLSNGQAMQGGGLGFVFTGHLTIADSNISGNTADDGGAILIRNPETAELIRTTLSDNTTLDQGLIAAELTDIALEYVEIENNDPNTFYLAEGAAVEERFPIYTADLAITNPPEAAAQSVAAGTPVEFEMTVGPEEAELPITYTVDLNGKPLGVFSSDSNPVVFQVTPKETGTNTVEVTAQNSDNADSDVSEAAGQIQFEVVPAEADTFEVYIPLVLGGNN